MTSVLPTPEQYADLAPTPGSPVWRAFNDPRMLSTAGYALMLQVAHPTVGYGVHQYSSFTKDPWGRLLRTLDYVHGTIYGGPELAGEIGRRVREMHKTIKGELPDGSRYHAMEPEAFAWVHATLAAGVVEGHRRLATPFTPEGKEELWAQWLRVGRLVGVRDGDLPATWVDFEPYFADVVAGTLRWTPAVPEVLETIARPMPPDLPGVTQGLWKILRAPLSLQLRVTTTGMLPRELRRRLGLRWTRRDATTFRGLAAASRASRPLVRGKLADFGPTYVRYRREALQRGDVAGGRAAPRGAEQAVA